MVYPHNGVVFMAKGMLAINAWANAEVSSKCTLPGEIDQSDRGRNWGLFSRLYDIWYDGCRNV